jgi:RNA 2',3'-cyclic 3'-phosphodiesterase
MVAGDGLTRRLFLGVDLDNPCRDSFERLTGQLARCIEGARTGSRGRVKWVARDNLHVTIKFLGATAESRFVGVQTVLTPPLSAPVFEMWFNRLGLFPERGAPRAVWAGASAGLPEAEEVQQELDRRLREAGVPGERGPFRLHLTLGRFRTSGRSSDRRAIQACTMEPVGPLVVDHITFTRAIFQPAIRSTIR